MKQILDKLEKRFNRFAIPRLALLLVMGQSFAYLTSLAKPEWLAGLVLDPAKIMEGEVWRLTTFLFVPPASNPFFILFALLVFLLMGESLEHTWGEFRFNLYIFVGYLSMLVVGFFLLRRPSVGLYLMISRCLMTSVFLAFAYLNPNFELLLFFILPIKVKWLALLTWVLYGLTVLQGDWNTRFIVLGSVVNFAVFFLPGMAESAKMARRKAAFETQVKQTAPANEPFHCCAVCGLSDKDAPDMDFRVCMECTGGKEYCRQHLHDHTHE